MGGLAFASAGPDNTPLNVPRMPQDVYATVSEEVRQKLRTLFQYVEIPAEIPGKQDYGDIDFFVMAPFEEGRIVNAIKEVLKTQYHVDRGSAHSFAVHYPGRDETYIQVDVENASGGSAPEDLEHMQWTLFMKSYSDLLQIIGISHRSLGLTCNDQGLHVRIEEIEPYDRKKSLVFLTSDPKAMMGFYGLDFQQYKEGFKDLQDIFDWVSSGRYFTRNAVEIREEKANDRARFRKRPMYRKFIEEYIPSHPNVGTTNSWTRKQVLEDAIDTFKKRDVYLVKVREHELREREAALWGRIRKSLGLEGRSLSTALKGLRFWVDFENGQPFIRSTPHTSEQPPWSLAITNEDALVDWVGKNWEKIKDLEQTRASNARAAGKNKEQAPPAEEVSSPTSSPS